jgi:histone deacetylase 11
MVSLVYHPRYNITAFGLERLHPFDSLKYRRIHDWLIRQGLRTPDQFHAPQACPRHDLLRVHTADYLDSLGQRSVLARALEVSLLRWLPASLTAWRVLAPMRLAAGGTILACRLAREGGLAINLGGGFHHAAPTAGGGFCVFADIPVALASLHAEKPFHSVLIVDTDAHQGNGTAVAIRSWPWAHLLDLFEADLFPWPKASEEMPMPLSADITGPEYLDLLATHLATALERFQPELIVYNAGSDVLATDPLTRLGLTDTELIERDLHVVTAAHERGIPVAMVLSGGYGPHSWLAHARSIEALLTRFDTEVFTPRERGVHRA